MRHQHLWATIAALFIASAVASAQQGQIDTIYVSDLFTTHIVYNTDLIYADLSNSQVMAAKILEQSKNMIALKARTPFDAPLSVSALESNGVLHTVIVRYQQNPQSLIHDKRRIASASDEASGGKGKARGKAAPGGSEGLYRKWDAPLIQDVVAAQRSLWHIASRQYDIEVCCSNILSYSDVTYLVFTLENKSGVSYECPDATFVVESRKKSKKSVVYDRNLFPKSRYGTLSCAPGEKTAIGYSMDKLSLSKDQILRVYFYESGGQRELVLTLSAEDINKSRSGKP